jgi:hypothetical protein
MPYSVTFETDSLPLAAGEYQSLYEAYEVSIQIVKEFKEIGMQSLYKFRVEQICMLTETSLDK